MGKNPIPRLNFGDLLVYKTISRLFLLPSQKINRASLKEVRRKDDSGEWQSIWRLEKLSEVEKNIL